LRFFQPPLAVGKNPQGVALRVFTISIRNNPDDWSGLFLIPTWKIDYRRDLRFAAFFFVVFFAFLFFAIRSFM